MIPPEDEATLSPRRINELIKTNTEPTLLTQSIRNAIDSFILGCAARTVRGHHKKHMTMLLHVSHLTDIQAKLKKEVDEYLNTLKFAAESNEDSLTSRLKKLWAEDFEIVSRDFEGIELCEFEKIWKYNFEKFGDKTSKNNF